MLDVGSTYPTGAWPSVACGEYDGGALPYARLQYRVVGRVGGVMGNETNLRKRDYRVEAVPELHYQEAKELVCEFHYMRGCSHTFVYLHGLYRNADNKLCGVAMWLPPTKVAAKTVSWHWQRVLALSRLVVVPDVPTCGASFLLGRSIRLVYKEKQWHTLLTYADEREGHVGQIYRATNWEYLGRRRGATAWWDPKTGRRVARKACRSRRNAELLALGYEKLPGSYWKHKFVFRLWEPSVEQSCSAA